MILVRSHDISDVPNEDDAKIPIMEFFQHKGQGYDTETCPQTAYQLRTSRQTQEVTALLVELLSARGYSVRDMGVVWKGGLCVENKGSDTRAAVMLDCAMGSTQDWEASYLQQKAIELVGWKCLRVDVLSFLTNTSETMKSITLYLQTAAGVALPAIEDEEAEDDILQEPQVVDLAVDDDDLSRHVEVDMVQALHEDGMDAAAGPPEPANDVNDLEQEAAALADSSIVVVSSDDENDKKPSAQPDIVPSHGLGNLEPAGVDPSNFGAVVDLGFLKVEDGMSSGEQGNFAHGELSGSWKNRDDDYQADEETDKDEPPSPNQRKRKYRRRVARKASRWQADTESDDDDEEEGMEKEPSDRSYRNDETEDEVSVTADTADSDVVT